MRRIWRSSLVAALALSAAASAEDDGVRARRAVEHLISVQRPDGLFRYDFDFLAGAPTGQDNVVRQAGTLFALGEYLEDTGDPRLPPVLRAGLEALAARSLAIGSDTPREWAVWLAARIGSLRLVEQLGERGLLYRAEGPGRVVSEDGEHAGVYAGATALALLAELAYHAATGDDRYRELREAWLAGLHTLWLPGEGIRRTPETLLQDPFTDGEAWLAFAVHAAAFPGDEEAARILTALEDYLLDHYGSRPVGLFYHWGAMASAARLAERDDPRIRAFAAREAEGILEARSPERGRYLSCALVEGLASSYAALRGHRDDLAARLRARIESELAHNRTLQIPPRSDRLALGGGGTLLAPTLAEGAGGFRSGVHLADTRIDNTQHCLSALLKARRYGVTGPPPGK